MTFITLAVVTALCLVLPFTRTYGVIGAGLLLYFYPYLTLGVSIVAGMAFLYLQRRHANAM